MGRTAAAWTVVWVLAAEAIAMSPSAWAHGIAGNRFFPGTMTFDDPAVADEFLTMQSALLHPLDTGNGFNVLDSSASWSFDRLLTPQLAFEIASGWIHRSGAGFPAQSGFDQTSIALKRLMYRSDLHEVLISVSLGWGLGGSGAQGIGANSPNTLIPSITFGKGFGDLPDGLAWFRPLAITGAVSAEFPTTPASVNFGFDSTTGRFGPTQGANADILHWGLALEYSTLYLTERFTPGQLPKEEPLHQLVPLVDLAFDSPVGQRTAATANPGLSYVEDVWQVSAEVIVPLNAQGGHGLGCRTQLLLFLDDLAPSLFGRPLVSQ